MNLIFSHALDGELAAAEALDELSTFDDPIARLDYIPALEPVNVFSDIVVDSFRLERSQDYEEKVLAVLGLNGDLKRWYRDQSYCIEIRETPRARSESYPSAPVKWRLTDPVHHRHAHPEPLPGMGRHQKSI
jgi:hypothetical protein